MKHINSYLKEMNQDISKAKYPEGMYFDMFNFDLVTDESGLSTGDIVNKKGNSAVGGVKNVIHLKDFANQVPNIPGLLEVSQVRITVTGENGFTSSQIFSTSNPLYNEIFDYFKSFSNIGINTLIGTDETGTSFHWLKEIYFYSSELNLTSINLNYFNTVTNQWVPADSSSFTQILIESKINGFCSLRDKIVLFSTDSEIKNPIDSYGLIWITELDNLFNKKYLHLRYVNKLNFSLFHPIKSIGYHITNEVEKVYFTDGYNELRHFNIGDPNGSKLKVDKLSMLPNNSLKPLVIKSIGTGGKFSPGLIQYGYSLYNKFGAETKISSLSNLFAIKADNILTPKNDDIVSMGFVFDIDLDLSFNFIKVYRIHHFQEGVLPKIDLIINEEYSKEYKKEYKTFTFSDDGIKSLGTYSPEEFLLSGGTNLVVKDIASKDNILFASNIKEKEFDVDYDARAYSFKLQSTSIDLYDKNNTLSNFNNYADVPVEHDCINPIYWDSTLGIEAKGKDLIDTTQNYWYKRNSTKFGGSGENISYEFVYNAPYFNEQGKRMTIDNKDSAGDFPIGIQNVTTPYPTPLFFNKEPNYRNPAMIDLKSFQRGEIYRLGIKFYKNGQSSFVKWISDVRIPDTQVLRTVSNQESPLSYIAGNNVYINPTHLKFDVNISQSIIDSGVTGFEIVKVKRKEIDRTVAATGFATPVLQRLDNAANNFNLLCPLPRAVANTSDVSEITFNVNFSGNVYHGQTSAWQSGKYKNSSVPSLEANVRRDVLLIYCPEVFFNKDLRISNNSYVEVANLTTDKNTVGQGIFMRTKHKKSNLFSRKQVSTNKVAYPKIKELYYAPTALASNYTEKELWLKTQNFVFQNYIPNTTAALKLPGGMGGSAFLLELEEDFIYDNLISTDSVNNAAIIMNIKNVLTAQYGGNTFNTRSNNIYEPASEYVHIENAGNYVCFASKGDTVIDYYQVLKLQRRLTSNNANSANSTGLDRDDLADFFLFPMESYYNISNFNNTNAFYNYSKNWLRETKELTAVTYSLLHNGANLDLSNVDDQYQINEVYHNSNNLKQGFAKPSNYVSVEHNDIQIRWSDAKQRGSFVDTWTLFKPNSAKEVNSLYGKLTAIQNLNDEIFFFQKEAVGLLSVNPRIVLQNASERNLEIGVGDIVQDFKYLSTNQGTPNWNTVISGDYLAIFFDSTTNRLCLLEGNGVNEVSYTAGMDSYFRRIWKDEQNTHVYEESLWNPFLNSGMSLGYDSLNKNFIISSKRRWQEIGQASDPIDFDPGFDEPLGEEEPTYSVFNDTILLSEYSKKFRAREPYVSAMYIDNNNKLLSIDNNLNTVYVHGKGNYGSYYGIVHDSYVTILVSPKKIESAVFNNLLWKSEVIQESNLGNTDLWNETVSTIEAWNDYQRTDEITLSHLTNSRRRVREWRTSIPRNKGTLERMRDYHLFIKLKFNNTGFKRFVLSDIVTFLL